MELHEKKTTKYIGSDAIAAAIIIIYAAILSRTDDFSCCVDFKLTGKIEVNIIHELAINIIAATM